MSKHGKVQMLGVPHIIFDRISVDFFYFDSDYLSYVNKNYIVMVLINLVSLR